MRRSLLLLVSAVLLPACSSSKGAPPAAAAVGAPRTDPDAVHVVGSTFRDGRGRQLLFRGYNAKFTTIFDVTFEDGRTPNETFPDFTEAEATRFEQLGFNVMRLPINWSGLEPHPEQYAEAFLQKIGVALDMARRHHFYVIIDMHQDAYSKEIGEDGQPLWAIVPPPTQLLSGPSDDSRRLTDQVLRAGYSFFEDSPPVNATDGRPLQSAYITAVQKIVARYLGNPAVLGYEAFNEPVLLYQTKLVAFHEAFADGVHAIDADAPILFEPISTRNQLDQSVIPGNPWSHGPGSYAIHIYTGWFSMPDGHNWASMDPTVLAPSMAHGELERAAWGTPLFVTEFGCDQTVPQGPPWTSAELDLQDQYLASSTIWEFSGLGAWGFHDANGNERPTTTHIVARTYPRAVAGDLLKIERPKPGDMIVQYRPSDATRGLEHEVSLSSDYVTSPRILCDGQPITFTPAPGRATFVCPAQDNAEHTFEVVGTPTQ
jgi:endoglycosylceramidase